jgi:hypothetical protein
MATFYLLPARRHLGQQFAALLTSLFPGLSWPAATWHDLAESLAAAAQVDGDRYVVFAEDLPDDLPLEEALALYFGAEAGDEIVRVRPGPHLADVVTQSWVHGPRAKAA